MSSWRGLVDALSDANGALWFGETDVDANDLVGFLLERQIRTGRSAGLFQPTAADYEERRLVTGERLKTKLATTHIMSQEAASVLHILDGGNPTVADAVRLAAARLSGTCYGGSQHCTIGECAASFIGYLRFLRIVGGEYAAPEITRRLATLSGHRDGSGRWKRFPFQYTLLVLSEIESTTSRDELAYARPALAHSTAVSGEPYAKRRAQVAATVLAALGSVDS
jgi:hypothetical protein